MVFANAYVSLNGTELKVVSATVAEATGEVDVTKMGDSATNTKLGIQTGDQITLVFNQDFSASGNTHALAAAAYANCRSGGTANVVVRPSAAAASVTNPEFRLAGVIPSYQPFGASVGDKSPVTLTIKTAGTAIVANTGA
jgi:hypothetical protein